MKKLSCVFALILIISCTGTQSNPQNTALHKYTHLDDPDIQNGEKLADVMLCSMCHSPMSLKSGFQMYNPV